MVSSQRAVPCQMWSGGHALSEKDSLGRARHECRRTVSIWGSCRSDSVQRLLHLLHPFRESKVTEGGGTNCTAQEGEADPCGWYVRRERIVGGICIIRDVEEKLRSIQVEPTSWPILLHNTQGSCQVDGRAAEGAII